MQSPYSAERIGRRRRRRASSPDEGISQLVSRLAEPALRERGLMMRPIPYFERYDRFQAREAAVRHAYHEYLAHMDEPAADRFCRAYTFADELSREVLENFYPTLPAEGQHAQCTLWGTAVVLDHLLDEDGVDPNTLAPMREWVARQGWDSSAPEDGRPHPTNPRLEALTAMLEDILADCRRRGEGDPGYQGFTANLMRMLEAELASVDVTLDMPPLERGRAIVRDKSVLLGWVGFQACALGQPFDPREARELQQLCDALGEVLWIMDDLVDLEEDLELGIWNRALWQLYDELGVERFGELIVSKRRLAEGIIEQGLVEREIDEIAKRVAFLESHARVQEPDKLRALMSFWVTSWMGIYR